MPRSSEFTQEVADTICERIALGESLRTICKDEAMPAMSTVFKWLGEQKAFSERYARAREAQADALFDEILDISDAKAEDVQRSRLMVDARKWMAGKLRPKVYGEKLDLNHAGGLEITRVTRRIVDPQADDRSGN